MTEEKTITIEVLFKTENEGDVGCIINIRDNVALCRFSNRTIARKIYFFERKAENDVHYMERITGFKQNYPGKTKEQIRDIIKSELEKEKGIKIKEK